MDILKAAEKRYAWGSRSAIQELTGIGGSDEPLAEIWYGAHPAGPATIEDGRSLDDLIAEDPVRTLGNDVAQRFDGQLPFLVKLIAPGQAVSLQVHPQAQRAREAYAEELAKPEHERRFVDARHKPEQILALSPFEGLVGLRPASDASAVLAAFDHPLTRAARRILDDRGERAIHGAVSLLAGASPDDVDQLVELSRALVAGGPHPAAETLLELAEQYSRDAGLAVSLMLCRIRLAPGESVMVPSGVPHAYMSGLALEVMANSDNVFRLGLTAKRVDVEEAVSNLITSPAVVNRPHRGSSANAPEEFHLEVLALQSGGVDVSGAGPRIVVALTELCVLRSEERNVMLGPGGAVFIRHGESVAATAAESGRIAVISVLPAGEGA